MAFQSASLEYLKWDSLYETEKPYEVLIPLRGLGDSKDAIPRSNIFFEPNKVLVHDARGSEAFFTLDPHGFQLVEHQTTVSQLTNPDEVTTKYIPEMQKFLVDLLDEGPAVKAHCFDIRTRKSIDPEEFSKRTVNLENGFDPLLPSTHPHIGQAHLGENSSLSLPRYLSNTADNEEDQSPTAAIRRVHQHFGDEAEELLKGRVRIINTWRPLRKVTAWPLAFCDATTVVADDLIQCDIVRRRFVGETLFGKYNPDHKWYYLSNQDVNEVAVLQIYDSAATGSTKSCLHSSFSLADAEDQQQEARESIELRFLVFSPS